MPIHAHQRQPYLEGSQISPGQLPGQEFPEDETKTIYIRSLAVVLLSHHLRCKPPEEAQHEPVKPFTAQPLMHSRVSMSGVVQPCKLRVRLAGRLAGCIAALDANLAESLQPRTS